MSGPRNTARNAVAYQRIRRIRGAKAVLLSCNAVTQHRQADRYVSGIASTDNRERLEAVGARLLAYGTDDIHCYNVTTQLIMKNSRVYRPFVDRMAVARSMYRPVSDVSGCQRGRSRPILALRPQRRDAQ